VNLILSVDLRWHGDV